MAKGLTAAELRPLEPEELVQKLAKPRVVWVMVPGKPAEKKAELFNLRFQSATGQLESHGRLRAVRHEIARIYTVMRERELGIITVEKESSDG